MARLGRLWTDNGVQGRISLYSWSPVKVVPAADLPGDSYAFWITGKLGSVEWLTGSPANHHVELALGAITSGGTLIDQTSKVVIKAADASLGILGPNGGLDGIPFQILLVLDAASPIGAHPIFGTAWNPAHLLTIFARLVANGDPPGLGVAVGVFDLTITAWDINTIASESIPYLAEEYAPTQAQNLTGITDRILTFGTNPPGSAGETWLVFHSIVYRPYGSNGGPTFALGYSITTPAPALIPIDQVGIDGRETGTSGAVDAARRHVHGGIATFVQDTGLTTLGWMGRDSYVRGGIGLPAFQTEVYRAALFAIRLKNAAGVSDLYGLQLDDANDWLGGLIETENVLAPVGNSIVPFEFQVPAPTELVVYSQAKYGTPRLNVLRSYSFLAFGDNFTPVVSAEGCNAQARTPRELVPAVSVFDTGGLPISDVRLELARWDGVLGSAYGEYRPASWYRSVAFSFETDPSNLDLPAVPPGSVIAIVPDRESLDVGSLPVLPRQPDFDWSETVERPEHVFRADIGYRWTLPRFTAGRRELTISFSSVEAPERDSLLAFFRSSQAFAWAPPGETAAAWLVVDRPAASQGGILWSVSVRILELVFTGP